jgi:hypothetical protein
MPGPAAHTTNASYSGPAEGWCVAATIEASDVTEVAELGPTTGGTTTVIRPGTYLLVPRSVDVGSGFSSETGKPLIQRYVPTRPPIKGAVM